MDPLSQIRAARQAGKNESAIDLIRRIIGANVKLGPAAGELLHHAIELADEDAALVIARTQLNENPGDPRHALILAERFSRVGQSDLALQLVERVSVSAPANPAIDYFLGVYSGHVGKIEDARRYFRKALAAKPDFGDAWALLGASGGITADDEAKLKALVASGSPHAMPGAAYALGGYYHSAGQNAEAMAAWQAANDSERARRPFNLQGELKGVEDIRLAHDRLADPVIFEAGGSAPSPIFVVGAPRSGTSLTEQIIASAEGVSPLGETMLSRLASWSLGNLGQDDLARVGAFEAGRVNWQRMGDVYRKLAASRAREAVRVTDKGGLLNLFVGVLARCLPDAQFVLVRRDPRDNALSGYRAYLGDGNRWRQDFSDAAAYLKAHGALLDYWAEAFPDRTITLEYESLATHPQAETDRLMAFLGLSGIDVDNADFGRSNVPTASFAQIRSRISPSSVGGWRAYGAWIDPAFAS